MKIKKIINVLFKVISLKNLEFLVRFMRTHL